jgi:Protein of unknown function (DUF1153)
MKGALPPPDVQRWTAYRKAAVVAAVASGKLTREQACRLYEISLEEILSWEEGFAAHGLPGLRARRPRKHRRDEKPC